MSDQDLSRIYLDPESINSLMVNLISKPAPGETPAPAPPPAEPRVAPSAPTPEPPPEAPEPAPAKAPGSPLEASFAGGQLVIRKGKLKLIIVSAVLDENGLDIKLRLT